MPVDGNLRARWLLLAIVVLGACLRLYKLDVACLWIDEITFVNESNAAHSLWSIAKRMHGTYHWQHQPALPRMIESAFLKPFTWAGITLNETIYRLPAAFTGIASIGVMFLLGRRMHGERVGLLAAFLLSTNFLHIYYSREAYNYSPFFLCALLSWLWLLRIADDLREGGSPARRDLVWYAVFCALTLQMVMAGILFVIMQFFVWAFLPRIGAWRGRANTEKAALLRPVLVAYALAWVPFLPFLWKVFHYESADKLAQQTVDAFSFLKLIGEMGWSSRPAPLALFLLLIVAGMTLAISRPATRFAAGLALFLGCFTAAATGYIEQLGRYETRYFMILVASLVLFVAVAWDFLVARAVSRWPKTLQSIGWAIPCVALVAWNAPFYLHLFQIQGKQVCGRDIARWLNENTPDGSTYVADSFYLLREVPGFYGTPGRFESGPPTHTTPEEYEKLGPFFRDLFRRFPDCYYVDVTHRTWTNASGEVEFDPRETFARHVAIENPSLVQLARWGIWPSEAFNPHVLTPRMTTAKIHFNTRDDLLGRKRAAGEPALALFGKEWIHCVLPDGSHWKAVHSSGAIEVIGVRQEPAAVSLVLHCLSRGVNQDVVVRIGQEEQIFPLRADTPESLALGELKFKAPDAVVSVEIARKTAQHGEEYPNFLVHELAVRTIR